MKIKRRWKVMAVLPMVWFMVGLACGIPLLEHGYEAWIEAYGNTLLMFAGWFLGTITGVIMFVGAMDAEERENADFKFKDRVYETYNDYLTGFPDFAQTMSHDNAIDQTAIARDISPSHARNIVKDYKA
jgi:hypothetical protein